MLTASNRTTRLTQEVTATSKGEVLMLPGDVKVAALADTGVIAGPIRLVGIIIQAGTESAQMTSTADGSTVFIWKATGAGYVSGMMLPNPIACPNGITATRNYGNGATFLVYYIED